MRGRRLCAGLCVALACSLIACGSEELRSTEQAANFVRDVAGGGKADDWKLASGSAGAAIRAWADKGTISDLGERLRNEGPEWACKAADAVENAHKVFEHLRQELTTADREAILETATEQGAERTQADSLVDEALRLTDSELAETIAQGCKAGKGL